MIVLPQDLRLACPRGYCHRGGRAFCARHGIDWGAFIKHGIESEKLLATGDAMAERVVKVAEVRCGQKL